MSGASRLARAWSGSRRAARFGGGDPDHEFDPDEIAIGGLYRALGRLAIGLIALFGAQWAISLAPGPASGVAVWVWPWFMVTGGVFIAIGALAAVSAARALWFATLKGRPMHRLAALGSALLLPGVALLAACLLAGAVASRVAPDGAIRALGSALMPAAWLLAIASAILLVVDDRAGNVVRGQPGARLAVARPRRAGAVPRDAPHDRRDLGRHPPHPPPAHPRTDPHLRPGPTRTAALTATAHTTAQVRLRATPGGVTISCIR